MIRISTRGCNSVETRIVKKWALGPMPIDEEGCPKVARESAKD